MPTQHQISLAENTNAEHPKHVQTKIWLPLSKKLSGAPVHFGIPLPQSRLRAQ